MMNTKTRKPKGARSLAVTLAIAFFALSVVILLVNGALAGFSNYLTYQETNSIRQQTHRPGCEQNRCQFH